MTTLMVVAGLVTAFGLGWMRGNLAGIEQAWEVAQESVTRERSRCRRDQLGRLYGSEVIPRPSMAGRN